MAKGGVCGRRGVCGKGGMHSKGVCVAGGLGGMCAVETATEAGSTHPTGMHPCFSCHVLIIV